MALTCARRKAKETPVPGRLFLKGRDLRNLLAASAREQFVAVMKVVDREFAAESAKGIQTKMPAVFDRIISGIRNIFGPNFWGRLGDKLGDIWRRYFGRGGQQGTNDVRQGLQFGAPPAPTLVVPDFSLQTPNAVEMIRRIPIELAEYVNGTRRDDLIGLIERVRMEVERGIIKGTGYAEIADRIADHFADEAGYRAERIAITETQRAINLGTLEAYKQSGAVVGKKWLLSGAPCPFCIAIAEETEDRLVGLDEAFAILADVPGPYANIQCPPAHPNCQCSLQAVLATDLMAVPAAEAA